MSLPVIVMTIKTNIMPATATLSLIINSISTVYKNMYLVYERIFVLEKVFYLTDYAH